SVVIGVFLAFVVARYDFFGKRVLRTVLIFPILATPFIGAIGIKDFLGQYGVINNLFYGALGWFSHRIVIDGFVAVIFVQAFSFFSLVYLNAYSSFMGIDPSLEEQAENLGATGFKLFRSVTLPLAMPGIQAGAILTFILSIEDLGTPIIFRGQAEKTLAYMVFTNVATGAGTPSGYGPAVGMILLVIALLGFLAIRKYSSLRSYAAGTKGGQWNPRTRKLTGRGTLMLYAIMIPLLFVALIPQLSVILLSLTVSSATGDIIPPLTFENYLFMGATYPNVVSSIYLTLLYGAIATVIIVGLGASAAYLIARKDIPGKTALDMLVTSPIALPGIVIATGYFTLFYNSPFFPAGAPAFLIIMSYTIRKFPFTVRAAYAGLQSTPVDLEEAAQNMGASKNKTFTSITLPLIGVSVLAGSLLSFVYSVSEVSTSIILGSVGENQAPMTYWTYRLASTQDGVGPAACLGVLMMALQMAVITITNKILGTRSSAMTGI
ncbi:MAG: iron ABC transporter permease, partial [Candidatus Thorarchaeota archaeon]